jgi:hypothetical protein
MQEFIHNKINVIDNLIESYNDVQQLYIQNAFEFDNRFLELLNRCLEYFKTHGTNTQVSEVLNIVSMFETAIKGIHPYKLEKVSTGRRELRMMIAYHGLEKLHQLLSVIYENERHKLEEAEEILSNLLLSLHQSGFLDDNRIKDLRTIEKIKDFWQELLNRNGSISGINKKLRLKIIPEDIYLLIEKLIIRFN